MRYFVLMIALFAMLVMVGGAQGAVLGSDDHAPMKLSFYTDDQTPLYEMGTMGPSTGSVTIQADGMQNWTLNRTLEHDLIVYGEDLSGSDVGFFANIQIDCEDFTAGENTQARVSIFDVQGTNETMIAQSDWYNSQTSWEIPFVEGGKDDHTFDAGNVIWFRVEVETTDSIGGWCTVNTDSENMFLRLDTNPIESRFDVKIFDIKGNSEDQFEPNLPSHLTRLFINGTLKSSFGSYDVRRVDVTITTEDGLGSEIVNSSAVQVGTYDDPDDEYKYSLMWNWSLDDVSADDNNFQILVYARTGSNKTHESEKNFFEMLKYAVYEEFSMDKRALKVSGEIGSNVTFDFMVYNSGSDPETINLDAKPLDTDWTSKIEDDYDDPFILQPGDNVQVEVTVHIPDDVDPGDDTFVVLKATVDEGSGVKDQIQATVEARGIIKFKFLHQSDLVQEVGEGDTAIYEFNLKNNGTEETTFIIDTDDVDPLWDLTVEPGNSIQLDGGDTVMIWMNITAPNSQSDDQHVTIEAYPDGYSDMAQSFDTVTKFKSFQIISVTNDKKQSDVLNTNPWSYRQVSFTLDYENGEDDEQTVRTEIDEFNSDIDLDDWFYDLPDEFDLDSEASISKEATFTPPSDVEPGIFNIKLTVEFLQSGADGSWVVEITVPEKAVMATDVDGDTDVKVESGKKIEVEITVKNEGNFRDTFDITIDVPSSWKPRIGGSSGSSDEIDLDPDEEDTIKIEITAPDDARGEKNEFTITISSTDSSVKKTYKLEVEVEEESSDPSVGDVASNIMVLVIVMIVFIVIFKVTRNKRTPGEP